MLETCFIHLPGVGPTFEATLRALGVICWDDALSVPLPCSSKRAAAIHAGLRESRKRLSEGDARWFSEALPPKEQWRLYSHFKDSAAYVDIETTGLSWDDAHITTIALYDGRTVRTYVYGRNLEDFADDIAPYKLLITWNGRRFDAPILRKALDIPLDKGGIMGHLDLLPVFRALDLRGGLKLVEKSLGLSRNELDGVDGQTAVWLWNEFERTRNEAALATLLAYNVADVLSLEYLAAYAFAKNTTGCKTTAILPTLKSHLNPFTPDEALLRKILARHAPWC